MQSTCDFGFMSFTTVPRMKSIVSVELDVMTSEESVDIDAERTSTTTSAISRPSVEIAARSISGMTESKPCAGLPFGPTPISAEKSRPNPPRK